MTKRSSQHSKWGVRVFTGPIMSELTTGSLRFCRPSSYDEDIGELNISTGYIQRDSVLKLVRITLI